MTTLYKFTGPGGSSYHGGRGVWHPGRWRSAAGPLVPCRNGLHLLRADQLLPWIAPELWEAEADGETIEEGDKVVARRARVTRRVDAWNERTARLFAADCAERVLPIFEAVFPDDARPRAAIAAARRYAATPWAMGFAAHAAEAAEADAAGAEAATHAAHAAHGAAADVMGHLAAADVAASAAHAVGAANAEAHGYPQARLVGEVREHRWQSAHLVEMLELVA